MNFNSKSTLIPRESTSKRTSEIRNLIVQANHLSAAEDKEILKVRGERILLKNLKSNKHPPKMYRSKSLPKDRNKCLLQLPSNSSPKRFKFLTSNNHVLTLLLAVLRRMKRLNLQSNPKVHFL
jgi:hypothetical protein